MKLPLTAVLILIISYLTLVCAVCNVAIGTRKPDQQPWYELHVHQIAHQGHQNLSLTLEYEFEAVPEDVEITYVQLRGSEKSCTVVIENSIKFEKGFRVRMLSVEPVEEFYGNATIYGIRREN